MNAQSTKTKNRKKQTSHHKHHRLWVGLGCVVAGLLVLALLVIVAFKVSPWPNALLIRSEFTKGSEKTSAALAKYVPADITQVENQQYRQKDKDAYLDVFYPDNTNNPRPTVVWVHGGAWVSGNKDQIDNYMKILASHGFTTVSVNYSIAPEKQYPVPIIQLNDALGYIQQNAERLKVDTSQIFLAGDSAGSQIVAQMANIVTSHDYAEKMNISPQLSANKLRGLLLNCGAYDLALPDYNGAFGGFLHTVLWAYSGTKNFLHDPRLETASVINYLTSDFPPSFITAGNVDPLLDQSTELAQKLKSLHVTTSTLFYPADYQPALNHEYQFDLDTPEGKRALEQMVTFLQQHDRN